MLEQEISEMDRVTQLQDAIEEVRLGYSAAFVLFGPSPHLAY